LPPSVYLSTIYQIPLINILFKLPDPNYNVYLFLFAWLITLGLISTSKLGNQKNNPLIIVYLTVIIIYTSVPIYLSQDKYSKLQFPAEYQTVLQILNNDSKLNRVFLLPNDITFKRAWAKYPYFNAYDWLSQKHDTIGVITLESNSSALNKYNKLVRQYIETNNFAKLRELSRLFGMNYYLIHKDVDYKNRQQDIHFFRLNKRKYQYDIVENRYLMLVNLNLKTDKIFISKN